MWSRSFLLCLTSSQCFSTSHEWTRVESLSCAWTLHLYPPAPLRDDMIELIGLKVSRIDDDDDPPPVSDPSILYWLWLSLLLLPWCPSADPCPPPVMSHQVKKAIFYFLLSSRLLGSRPNLFVVFALFTIDVFTFMFNRLGWPDGDVKMYLNGLSFTFPREIGDLKWAAILLAVQSAVSVMWRNALLLNQHVDVVSDPSCSVLLC